LAAELMPTSFISVLAALIIDVHDLPRTIIVRPVYSRSARFLVSAGLFA
jgi:hypothetical protein